MKSIIGFASFAWFVALVYDITVAGQHGTLAWVASIVAQIR